MPEFWQNVVGQITVGSAGIWLLVMGGLVHLFREWRLTRKLSIDDRIARRDGYAAQVTNLAAENRALRTEMDSRDAAHVRRYHDLEQKYDAYRELCERTEEQHRAEIFNLMQQAAGFKRRLDAVVAAVFRLVPEDLKTEIMIAASERVDIIISRGEADDSSIRHE